jgi:hypothetical protein
MDRFTFKRLGQPMVRNAVEGDYADGTGTKSRVYCFNNSQQAILNGNFLPQSQRDLNSNYNKILVTSL